MAKKKKKEPALADAQSYFGSVKGEKRASTRTVTGGEEPTSQRKRNVPRPYRGPGGEKAVPGGSAGNRSASNYGFDVSDNTRTRNRKVARASEITESPRLVGSGDIEGKVLPRGSVGTEMGGEPGAGKWAGQGFETYPNRKEQGRGEHRA